MPDETFPEATMITSGFRTLQNILSLIILPLQSLVERSIWDCSELEATSSTAILT